MTDAFTFYATTMGENQAPARQLLTKCRVQNFPWLATPNGRRYKNLCHRSGRNVAVPRGFGPPELANEPGGPRLGHHKSHHLPSHFLCAGVPNKTKAGPESKKNYTRTAQPARLPGELTIEPSFDVHLFCSLHYWGVST